MALVFSLHYAAEPCQADDSTDQAIRALDAAMEANAGENDPIFEQAMKAYLIEQYEKALPGLREAAEQGNAVAQNSLANMYNFGYGTEKNQTVADAWYEKSAAQGYPPALNNITTSLLGSGVEQKQAEGLRLLLQLSDQGNAPSVYRYALLLCSGKHVPKDPEKGLLLLEKLTNAGDSTAMSILGWSLLTGEDGRQDQEKGLELLRRSALLGKALAFYNLGEASEKGLGQPKDNVAALVQYRIAKRLGNKLAEKKIEALTATMSWQDMLAARRIFN